MKFSAVYSQTVSHNLTQFVPSGVLRDRHSLIWPQRNKHDPFIASIPLFKTRLYHVYCVLYVMSTSKTVKN